MTEAVRWAMHAHQYDTAELHHIYCSWYSRRQSDWTIVVHIQEIICH